MRNKYPGREKFLEEEQKREEIKQSKKIEKTKQQLAHAIEQADDPKIIRIILKNPELLNEIHYLNQTFLQSIAESDASPTQWAFNEINWNKKTNITYNLPRTHIPINEIKHLITKEQLLKQNSKGIPLYQTIANSGAETTARELIQKFNILEI